ncbi:phosphatidylinositol-specific phospholipase C [Cystobacter fuscus]
MLLPTPFAAAHGRYFNDSGSVPTSHPNWMRWIPSSTSVAALSLPGTHDTMANETEWYVTAIERAWILTQGMELRPQLDAGVRALDIRARHIGNGFTIHHGAYHLMANFDGVLSTAVQFLRDNPTETLLMRVKKEHTEENTTRSFAATFEWYRDQPAYSPYIWRGTHVPTLGEVRGKIVILDDFDGGDHGIGWGSLDKQDAWEETNTDTKWNLVRAHLEAASAGDPNTLYINFLSAAGVGGTPSAIAGSVNENALHYLMGTGVQRTGVLMMDFPGAGLIDAIIAHNFRRPRARRPSAGTSGRSSTTSPTAFTARAMTRRGSGPGGQDLPEPHAAWNVLARHRVGHLRLRQLGLHRAAPRAVPEVRLGQRLQPRGLQYPDERQRGQREPAAELRRWTARRLEWFSGEPGRATGRAGPGALPVPVLECPGQAAPPAASTTGPTSHGERTTCAGRETTPTRCGVMRPSRGCICTSTRATWGTSAT